MGIFTKQMDPTQQKQLDQTHTAAQTKIYYYYYYYFVEKQKKKKKKCSWFDKHVSRDRG